MSATSQKANAESRRDPQRIAARPKPNDSENERVMTHIGSCFCGAVELEVTGSPEAMGYCHCRSWSGGPVNAFSLWKPDAVRIKSGSEHLAMFQKTKFSQRQYCAKCG